MHGSLLFADDFSEDELTAEWAPHPSASISDGVLDFSPGNEGFALVTTRRADFDDICMEADVRIVSGAVGLVLRHRSPLEYYMVQLDLGAAPGPNANKVWFQAMSRSAAEGDCGLEMHRELIPSRRVPELGNWHRMRVTINGFTLRTFLASPGGPWEACAEWTDPRGLHAKGAVGFWECGGEHGQYRDLRVTGIPAPTT